EITFPAPLHLESGSWDVPTNLIREPLTSFTAVRGIKETLSSWKIWNDAQLGLAPNQLYFWSQQAGSFETYFAAPLPDARSRVREISDRLIQNANPWLDKRGYVSFDRLPDANGVTWGNLAIVKPFLTSSETQRGSVVFGGLLANPSAATNPPPRNT